MSELKNWRDIGLLAERVIGGGAITRAEAIRLLDQPSETFLLMAAAETIKRRFLDSSVSLCGIINAKSGHCAEDCAFCAQSAHHRTAAKVYPLKTAAEIYRVAAEAYRSGVSCFGIVTSGDRLNERELEEIAQAISRITREFPEREIAVSVGNLSRDALLLLKAAGLKKVHHNLETAPSFFPRVCSTHTYRARVETLERVKDAGLQICCGGILGLGESCAERVELALELAALNIDSVPLNFLNPIPGTRLYGAPTPTPREFLRAVAVFRFILPRAEIRICGGREVNLRSLQPLVLAAGASGIMTGDYLTTPGQGTLQDLALLEDLGLSPRRKSMP